MRILGFVTEIGISDHSLHYCHPHSAQSTNENYGV